MEGSLFSFLLLSISGISLILFIIIQRIKPLKIYILGMIGNAWAVKHLIGFFENGGWSLELEEGERSVKVQAARALGKTGDVQAVKSLIGALRYRYSSIREAAVEALGEIGDVQAVEPLIRMFGDNNLVIRVKAMEIVEQIGSPAVEPLIRALGDKKQKIRYGAVVVLGRLVDIRAVEPLIKMLYDHPIVGEKAAEALEGFGSAAVEGLMRVLGDIDEDVREKATETLKIIFTSVIDTVVFGDSECPSFNQCTTLCNFHVSQFPAPSYKQTLQIYPDSSDPHASELTIPMENLERIVIYSDTYNFHQVERFLTYAVNYIGQKHLKQHVEVDIYGDPDKLHPNLRNNFEHLCKGVKFRKG